jgi:MscS family membrane protein
MDMMSDIFWNNPVWKWTMAGGAIAASVAIAWLVAILLRRYVVRVADQTESRLDDLVAEIGVRPIALIIFLAGAYGATESLKKPEWLDRILWSFFVVGWTVVGTVFLVRLIGGILANYVQRFADDSEELLYRQLVRTVRSSVRVVVWLVAMLFMVSNLGLNISSLLAGLGLGGLALALASKDTLSNIFGSFTILVNGPYRVGEAVKYQSYSGVVESIGLRDTKIRTWNGHLVVVPNSLAPNSVVENISRRPSYRSLFSLSLTYDTTSEQLDKAKEIVHEAVSSQKGTTEDIRFHFLEFDESSINVQVIYFIEETDRALDIRHAVNDHIKREFDKAGIKFAFKTITLDKS